MRISCISQLASGSMHTVGSAYKIRLCLEISYNMYTAPSIRLPLHSEHCPTTTRRVHIIAQVDNFRDMIESMQTINHNTMVLGWLTAGHHARCRNTRSQGACHLACEHLNKGLCGNDCWSSTNSKSCCLCGVRGVWCVRVSVTHSTVSTLV